MTKQAVDDLEAVRAVITALDGFQAADQERILRWAREKIGLPSNVPAPTGSSVSVAPTTPTPAAQTSGQGQDIKTFVLSRNPRTDTQFAAAVAYYYRFEAPEADKKESITSDDLQEATRKVGRDRLARPAQTLINAHQQGVLDKADRGNYTINTVGENLVAMALGGEANEAKSSPRRRSHGATKKAGRSQKQSVKKTKRG